MPRGTLETNSIKVQNLTKIENENISQSQEADIVFDYYDCSNIFNYLTFLFNCFGDAMKTTELEN